MNKIAVLVFIVSLAIIAMCSKNNEKSYTVKTPPKPQSVTDHTQAFKYDAVLTPAVDKGINDALVGTTIYTSLPR